MSECIITRRGGSGGLSPNNAVIHVNAPVGSTVTFAKGGVTVKVLDASKGHANVDGESADYYLSVSASNYGTWTVTATLGIDTASDTVTVDSAEQYDVLIDYGYWFIKNGEIKNSLAFTTSDSGHIVITENYQDNGFLRIYRAKNSGGMIYYFNLTPGYDFGQGRYTKMYIDVAIVDIYRYNADYAKVGVGTQVLNSSYYASAEITTHSGVTERHTAQIDVSNIGVSACYKMSIGASSNNAIDIQLYNVWLDD